MGHQRLACNKGDTHGFTSSMGDTIIESDKPVFIAGRLANDNYVRKANVVWSSPDRAGRESIFSVSRYAPHQITAMFEAGHMDIAEGTNPPTKIYSSLQESLKQSLLQQMVIIM